MYSTKSLFRRCFRALVGVRRHPPGAGAGAGAAVAVALATAVTVGGCSDTVSGRTVDSSSPESVHTFALEPGGDISATSIEQIVGLMSASLLESDTAVTVIVMDGPNAVTFERSTPPGTTSEGMLDTEAANSVARGDVIAELEPSLLLYVQEIFNGEISFDSGRDLKGGIERAARSGPDRMTVMFTSGGVVRTEDEDWLDDDVEMMVNVPIPETTNVDLHGVGAVPAPDPGPPKKLTDAVETAWAEWCADLTNCEVR